MRHRDVGQDDGRNLRGNRRERFPDRRRRCHLRARLLQDRSNQLSRVRVVVHSQHMYVLQRRWQHLLRRHGVDAVGFEPFAPVCGEERNANRECCAVPLAFALGLHGAAVKLGEVAHERQSQAEPRVLAGHRRRFLTKAVEDMRQEGGIDPGSRVAHGQYRIVAVDCQRDLDAVAGPSRT